MFRLRAQVATGATFQPPASNMMELEWDEELAAIAQRHADQCQVRYTGTQIECPINNFFKIYLAMYNLHGWYNVEYFY